MNKITDWPLLARYLSGECSQEERERIEKWIASDPENQRLTELMKITWKTPESRQQTSDVKKLWAEVAEKAGIDVKARHQKIHETPRAVQKNITKLFNFQKRSHQMLRYAAVLLVVSSLAYFFTKEINYLPWLEQVAELKTITIANGDRQKVVLSDGSTITLDAGSSLKYPESFEGDTREVFLNGEGFFEVKSNPQKPFIIHANNANVQVLGTKFNIRAWNEFKKVQVSVAEGKVSLNAENGKSENAVILTRGFSSILIESGVPSEPQQDDIEKYLGWMHNEVVFENTPLSEILFQLERWHDLQFILEDSSIASERLTVHIKEQSIKDILDLITALTDLHSVYDGKTIRLTTKTD